MEAAETAQLAADQDEMNLLNPFGSHGDGDQHALPGLYHWDDPPAPSPGVATQAAADLLRLGQLLHALIFVWEPRPETPVEHSDTQVAVPMDASPRSLRWTRSPWIRVILQESWQACTPGLA